MKDKKIEQSSYEERMAALKRSEESGHVVNDHPDVDAIIANLNSNVLKDMLEVNNLFHRMSDKMPFKEVFFKDDIEGMLFRSVPEQGLWAKFKGGSEEWKTSARQSKIVTDAILAGDEITREEYYR